MKYLFFDDCSEGVHPEILKLLETHNADQQRGYGNDEYTAEAANRIKKVIQNDSVDVHLVTGGTQANLICLASMLRPFEGIIAPTSGHIVTHESGAIEATGHKIITVTGVNGKLTPAGIDQGLITYENEHTVVPRVVFLTQTTELGTVYTLEELQEVSSYAHSKGLYVYLDGARLGTALASKQAGMSLADIAKCVDMFYIGGTKNGAMFGEAIVIINNAFKENFRNHLKQRGALLVKGRFLGLQFMRFFDTDNLYIAIGAESNRKSQLLFEGLQKLGVKFKIKPATNQIFPILSNSLIKELEKDYGFYFWEKYDENNSVVRLVCSWATPEDATSTFLKDFGAISKSIT
jgi:threonine aldolase